ncbi:MAG: hypothetical protein QNJ46_32890 [Leptolyngbyaceae cyanobacterium MO_188.B28]|nr:hypothetical protein [Leptolyngbyaceae cyanobacterium MO_188.B28]
MNAQWKKGLIRTVVWVTAEILLNCVGGDDLADYSEFIFERHVGESAAAVQLIALPG